MKKIKKNKPGATFSTSVMAHVLGVSAQRVSQLEREGVLHKIAHGLYGLEAITEFCEYQRKLLQDGAGGAGLAQERAELVHEKVLIAKMERKRMEKSLIPDTDIAPAFSAVAGVFRSNCLAFPSRMAPRVASACNADAVVVGTVLTAGVRELLETIASTEVVMARVKNGEPDYAHDEDEADPA
jgi:phage terminase Nu1 subunit (DNA packaging protein)